ncbi:hypothetical protein [Leisingera caerulea]|uniref:hypothetical protein n=1 Tax=Leisingera caerulea TaxID=506591 RepID=UPI0004860A7F|nr:hypothetical protein [Leisingera caerulea]
MESLTTVLVYLGYATFSVLFWWIYPHTLSRADMFSTSAVKYWLGRISFSLFGPGLIGLIVLYLYNHWNTPF